jgi:hypothetical protein
MIEQLAVALARVRRKINEGAPESGEELSRLAAQHGVDLITLRAVDGETLLLLLSPSGEPEPARTWIMAELVYMDALRLEQGGDADEARHAFAKALLLYELIDAEVLGGMPEAGDRIGELRLRLQATSD